MKATKKPVEIDFFEMTSNNIVELQNWVKSLGDNFEDKFIFKDQGPDGASLEVKTLEGTSYAVKPTHNIIRGVKGEYYPCDRKIFEETYDKEADRDMALRVNFLSVDKQSARDSYGTYWKVGEEVGHEGAEDTAIITSFEFNDEMDEVKFNSTKGFGHIDFLVKLEDLKEYHARRN